jgi:DNA repair protein RadD
VTKECTQCNELVAAAYRVCPQCGFEFPANDSLKHGSKAAEDDAVLSEQEKPAVWEVRDVRYSAHTKKNADESAPKTLRIDYFCGVGMRFSRWVCVEHSGFAHGKALEWWKENSNDPFPEDAQHAADICNAGGVALVETVTVRYEGKWPRIIGATTGSLPAPLEDFARHNEEEIPF